jgi:hypothetical protein
MMEEHFQCRKSLPPARVATIDILRMLYNSFSRNPHSNMNHFPHAYEKMSIPGVYTDKIPRNAELAKTLRADDMERFRAVPKTVMINQWVDDLDWLIVDRTYPEQIARRYEVLLAHREMAIDRLPGDDVRAAESELLATVADYLLQTYPQYFQREGDLILSPLTGLAIDIGSGCDPLIAAALLASEDLLLLLPEKSGPQGEISYVLKAGALLFPNEWSLRSHFRQAMPDESDSAVLAQWREAKQASEKAARLGKGPYAIHDGHVRHYVENFASRVDMFFGRLEPGMRVWRRNWGPRMTGEFFLHSDALPAALPALTPQNWAEFGYLRSEHEAFAKLPKSGAVVFSIKTFLWKLSELVKHPEALSALLVADDNLAPTMFEYRAEALPTFREFLAQYRLP